MAYSASVGLTALLDQVSRPRRPLIPTQGLPNLDQFRMYDGWLAVYREGGSFVRLQTNFLHNQNDVLLPELKERLKNQFQLFGTDMMMTGAIGEWGAPGDGSGAAARGAAGDRAGPLAEHEWTLSLTALQNVVAGLEAVAAEFDISDLRWTVHHVQVATNDLLNRLKAINVGVQGGLALRLGRGHGAGSPFRMIVDNGIKAGIHMDGVHIAPLTPWFALYYATTGVNALGEHQCGQQITRQEALGLYTRENAWHLNMEDKIGTIEPGSSATSSCSTRTSSPAPTRSSTGSSRS